MSASRLEHEAGRVVAGRAASLIEPIRHVEACAAGEDAHRPARITNAEGDRALVVEEALAEARWPAGDVRLLDARAVIDAGRALQRRGQDQLRGLDGPADSNLTGGRGRDRRRRGAADAPGAPIAAHAACQEPQPEHDADPAQDRQAPTVVEHAVVRLLQEFRPRDGSRVVSGRASIRVSLPGVV
jgi:hypothetical protein